MKLSEIKQWSEGNPGALNFIMQVLSTEVPLNEKYIIIDKIDRCNIRGTYIYVLYNDLCERDMKKVISLCKNCPDDVLVEVCNRQDRSGAQYIQKYLK